jgi:hypothetical protein
LTIFNHNEQSIIDTIIIIIIIIIIINDLYSSQNIIRVIKTIGMRWVRRVACMEQRIGVYKVLAGKPGGKKPLRRPMRRREDNIKMDLQEVGWGHGLD